ncbi:hypothetical protein Hanom_Chr00s000005g01610941 [Helianthus anomalus]
MTAGTTIAPAAVSISVAPKGATVVFAPVEVVSPPLAQKKRRILPPLTSFQAIKASHALSAGSLAEARVEGVPSVPLTTGDVVYSAASGPSLSDLISHASVAAVGSSMPPPVFTMVVVLTPSPVSTPLSSSATPMCLFDSPIGVFSASEKEMPTASVVCESTNARDTTVTDVGGSNGGFVDDESSRLIFPPVVHHWVERAYPPAESAYVEGLNNENLMNSSMVDVVSQPRRLAEIRRRWMHDNNELHQARVTIQELMDEKYRLESQLQATGLRESRFISEKNKAEADLQRVTTHLAEERILWARDITEKDRVLAHAKILQEEFERKVVAEAQKVRFELSTKMEKFRIDTGFVSRVQERYQGLIVELEASNAKVQAKQVELEEREEQLRKLQQLCDSLVSEKNRLVQSSTTPKARLNETESALDQSDAEVDSLTSRLAGLQGDRNWLITNGLVEVFEYLRQSESFVALLDYFSSAAYQSGHHDGLYHGYFNYQQTDRITPAFQENRGKL